MILFLFFSIYSNEIPVLELEPGLEIIENNDVGPNDVE